jgi:hypothetical protein
MNYLLGLASNCDPPDLCLLNSKNYRHEPLAPGKWPTFLKNVIKENKQIKQIKED